MDRGWMSLNGWRVEYGGRMRGLLNDGLRTTWGWLEDALTVD
jgi:hypothetical protein